MFLRLFGKALTSISDSKVEYGIAGKVSKLEIYKEGYGKTISKELHKDIKIDHDTIDLTIFIAHKIFDISRLHTDENIRSKVYELLIDNEIIEIREIANDIKNNKALINFDYASCYPKPVRLPIDGSALNINLSKLQNR